MNFSYTTTPRRLGAYEKKESYVFESGEPFTSLKRQRLPTFSKYSLPPTWVRQTVGKKGSHYAYSDLSSGRTAGGVKKVWEIEKGIVDAPMSERNISKAIGLNAFGTLESILGELEALDAERAFVVDRLTDEFVLSREEMSEVAGALGV